MYQPPSQPFTHYIRRLTAKLDPEQYGDGEEQVLWHKSQHTRNHRDSFEIRSDSALPIEVAVHDQKHSQIVRQAGFMSISCVSC